MENPIVLTESDLEAIHDKTVIDGLSASVVNLIVALAHGPAIHYDSYKVADDDEGRPLAPEDLFPNLKNNMSENGDGKANGASSVE